MQLIIVLASLFALIVAFPTDMNLENCKNDGIYWVVEPGDMISCSPTCDKTYRLNDANEVSAKSINEHCKLNLKVGRYYHDIANRTMCTCTNGAAYKELTSIDWTKLSQVSSWLCIAPSLWRFEQVDSKLYRVVCL
ncbi:uncharacterized protein LOC100903170 [Galendromus occidentalis]|uniref:Uncharacterized protein LOC100903170 n=1 Tax=Galendromus occidentalis TaxID=34638 RepID=A0AAJ6VX67_9ACAR|nr:uncharacterized protein LOC100903170 [Galendromus occidentalis]